MNSRRHYLATMLVLAALAGLPAAAQTGSCDGGDNYNCFVLRAPAGLISTIAQAHGLTVLEQLDANTPEVVLVNGPASQDPAITVADVESDPDVHGFESLQDAAITESLPNVNLDQSYATIVQALGESGESTADLEQHFTAELWNGYAAQPLANLVKLHEAHAYKDADNEDDAPYGYGVIAVIDTGVDPDHPLLADALVPGYDFILDQPGMASEWNALAAGATTQATFESVADQSYATIVQGAGDPVFTNAATGIVVDQSYATIVQGEQLPAAFGHGTMVAGIIRLVAPAAKIMPLRVFDGNGGANIFDIARAIHWAVDNGAHVINMSFSTEIQSVELMRAINYADRNEVAVVASAGNRGDTTLSFPAAFGNAIGVAATDDLDAMSGFSNYGPDLVHVAAPGEGFMTTYPGGLYSAAWGTSFSTAIVSGTVALLHHVEATNKGVITTFCNSDSRETAIALKAGVVNPSSSDAWGYGRLDVLEAVMNKVKGGTANCG